MIVPPILLTLLAIAPTAQAPAAPAWKLIRGSDGCTIERPPAAGENTRLVVTKRTGEAERILAYGPGWTGLAPGPIALELTTDWKKTPILLSATTRRRADVAGGMAIELERDGTPALLAARSVRFHDVARKKVIGSLEAMGDGLALARLRRCAIEIGQVDRGSRAAPVIPAEALPMTIGADDYPAPALRAGAQGRVAAMVTVSAQGRASACAVTQSSGSPLLDETWCLILARRGRFTPARDARGKATEGSSEKSIIWRLPE